MTDHTKKVIVLGGTGETGRRIIFHLCTTQTGNRQCLTHTKSGDRVSIIASHPDPA